MHSWLTRSSRRRRGRSGRAAVSSFKESPGRGQLLVAEWPGPEQGGSKGDMGSTRPAMLTGGLVVLAINLFYQPTESTWLTSAVEHSSKFSTAAAGRGGARCDSWTGKSACSCRD
mmetsp:Transcript_8099/g.20786  ORF Transcript_8099/g.20786 Transcript_8099/m.20786 type:complete len:115 (+) Transcript_8099:617-961(+)